MKPSGLRFGLRWLMIAVAVVACMLGAVAAFAHQPATLGSLLTGWAELYAIPLVLTFGRRVPFRRAARAAGRFILSRSPIACLFGLLCFAMSGLVGLAGGFALMMLVIGWASLFEAAFFAGESATTPDGLDLLPSMSPEGSSGRQSPRE